MKQTFCDCLGSINLERLCEKKLSNCKTCQWVICTVLVAHNETAFYCRAIDVW